MTGCPHSFAPDSRAKAYSLFLYTTFNNLHSLGNERNASRAEDQRISLDRLAVAVQRLSAHRELQRREKPREMMKQGEGRNEPVGTDSGGCLGSRYSSVGSRHCVGASSRCEGESSRGLDERTSDRLENLCALVYVRSCIDNTLRMPSLS